MNTLPLHDITRDRRAIDYFINELKGGTSVAARAKAALDFKQGRFLVALPEGTDSAALQDFAQSGYLRFGYRGMPTLARLAKAFAIEYRGAVLLQDTQASPGEHWLNTYKYRSHVVRFSHEIYWQISNPDMSDEDMVGLLNSASLYPFTAFFYISEGLSGKTELQDADLDRVVSGISGIAVGAFDEESFLLWWKDRLPLPVGIETN